MLVLITYDVNTEDAAGRKRLRQIAKKCVDYGQRVQNSVFECLLDAGQCRRLQAQLLSIMDPEKDSLRFYYLGKQYEKKEESGAFRCEEHLSAGGSPDSLTHAARRGCGAAHGHPGHAFPPPRSPSDQSLLGGSQGFSRENAGLSPGFSGNHPVFFPKNAKILLICQRSTGKTVHLCCRPPRGGRGLK